MIEVIPFSCTDCGFKCNDQKVFSDHVLTHTVSANADIHLDPTQENHQLKCPECEYKFDNQNILNVHMENHSKKKCLIVQYVDGIGIQMIS